MREEHIRALMKKLRHRTATLSVKRLLDRLDRGDKMLLEKLLEDLIRRVEYLHQLDHSKCSIVLEACGIFYNTSNEQSPTEATR